MAHALEQPEQAYRTKAGFGHLVCATLSARSFVTTVCAFACPDTETRGGPGGRARRSIAVFHVPRKSVKQQVLLPDERAEREPDKASTPAKSGARLDKAGPASLADGSKCRSSCAFPDQE